MPESNTIKRARQDQREGKAASTQAGEFVREEFHHIREGKHGARSTRQAIAIGLSKARRAGVPLPPPARGRASAKVRRQARRDVAYASHSHPAPSRKRSRATTQALKREGTNSASLAAISRQAHLAARHRTARQRSNAATLAVHTKGHVRLVSAAKRPLAPGRRGAEAATEDSLD